ncbi:hypothetical protein [Streptomyces sp. UNOC14_S4]|uniref:hypothetical protein n=1 Tax=Streptomyces sp. UNOC14_S4 TaxID=2872340 RepID=UPI001E2A426A|nr:hypothetical protein [Streptomyces sp. UNOC14_S4]MCC3770025.1 hypothetical protein [Streptomyces sp. UNOC14_S4]
MYLYVENRLHERISELVGDDAEASFMAACQVAPEGSVMSSVQRYGDTMLNEVQLGWFVTELSRLPEGKKTDVIRQVMTMAQEAASRHGYLYISGD